MSENNLSASILCQTCRKPVEPQRECYLIPTCYKCLPPPPELEIIHFDDLKINNFEEETILNKIDKWHEDINDHRSLYEAIGMSSEDFSRYIKGNRNTLIYKDYIIPIQELPIQKHQKYESFRKIEFGNEPILWDMFPTKYTNNESIAPIFGQRRFRIFKTNHFKKSSYRLEIFTNKGYVLWNYQPTLSKANEIGKNVIKNLRNVPEEIESLYDYHNKNCLLKNKDICSPIIEFSQSSNKFYYWEEGKIDPISFNSFEELNSYIDSEKENKDQKQTKEELIKIIDKEEKKLFEELKVHKNKKYQPGNVWASKLSNLNPIIINNYDEKKQTCLISSFINQSYAKNRGEHYISMDFLDSNYEHISFPVETKEELIEPTNTISYLQKGKNIFRILEIFNEKQNCNHYAIQVRVGKDNFKFIAGHFDSLHKATDFLKSETAAKITEETDPEVKEDTINILHHFYYKGYYGNKIPSLIIEYDENLKKYYINMPEANNFFSIVCSSEKELEKYIKEIRGYIEWQKNKKTNILHSPIEIKATIPKLRTKTDVPYHMVCEYPKQSTFDLIKQSAKSSIKEAAISEINDKIAKFITNKLKSINVLSKDFKHEEIIKFLVPILLHIATNYQEENINDFFGNQNMAENIRKSCEIAIKNSEIDIIKNIIQEFIPMINEMKNVIMMDELDENEFNNDKSIEENDKIIEEIIEEQVIIKK